MKDVADVEGDALPKSAAIGEDLDQAFLIVRGVDGNEAVGERWSSGVNGHEAELLECGSQRSGDQHGFMVVNFGG